MTYRCAIIGVSGGRARGHAEAYRHITRGGLVAVSARTEDKLQEFGRKYGVSNRYSDYREMLQRERLDLVQVNTPPGVRLEILQAAQEAGVPCLIVEKPLACAGEDYRAILEFSKSCSMKIAINHQLHFHPRRQVLQRFVHDGDIGEVRFIDASAGMNLAYQGTHCLQAIGAFLPEVRPVSVFAQIAGAQGLEHTPGSHYAPDQCVASISYPGGVSALLRCGENAPKVGSGPIYTHKRIAVYGSRGFVHWTMWSWETRSGDAYESGTHDYTDEDILGQAAMTEAMFDWLEDEGAQHPLHLESALQDFNLILGIYTSGLEHRVVDLPVDPAPGLVDAMRRRLSGTGGQA